MRLKRTLRATVFFSIALMFGQFLKAAHTFASFQEFYSAPGTEVKQQLNAVPLDVTNPLDRTVRSIMDELDQFNSMQTAVYWADGSGSNAHPAAGIGLDRAEVRKLAGKETPGTLRAVILFVLAHEQGHMAQFRYYDLVDMANPTKRRAVECQADILAGLSFTAIELRHANPRDFAASAQEAQADSSRIMQIAQKIGSPEWDDQTTHPRPEQRARAVSLGMLSRIQMADWEFYKRSHDSDTLRKIQSAEARFADIIHDGDNIFEWSNAAAKRIVRYESH
jgi:hypothetical protein